MLLSADVDCVSLFPLGVVACKDIILSPLREGTEVGIELLAQDLLFFLTGKLIS